MFNRIVIRVREVHRPISDAPCGFKIEAAMPNDAGRVMRAIRSGGDLVGFYATKETQPSFRRPYLVAERDVPYIDADLISHFVKSLCGFQKFSEVEYFGRFRGEMLADFVQGVAGESENI